MTITTELAQQQLEAIAELKAGYQLGHADVAILRDVARELGAARQRIAELEARTGQQPVGWTDAEELRDVEKHGCGYIFRANPISPSADPRRVIKLYTSPPAPAPVSVKLPERHEAQETSGNPYQSYIQVLPEAEGDWLRYDDVVTVLTAKGIKIAEGE